MRFAVFVRGINMGPRNRLPMADFRARLEEAGFDNVRTVANSGNAVLESNLDAKSVQARVKDILRDRFDLDVDVIVRDEHELRAIVADNPLGDVATDGKRQFVVFCSEPHDPDLLPDVAAPEQLVPRERELHVWAPLGVRDGRVMGELGRRPPAAVTSFRNWNTVAKLAELIDG